MGDIRRAVDLVAILQDVRRRCDECLRDRADPAAALRGLGPLLEQGTGQVHDLRPLAPGLGDLWDTLRTVHALAVEGLAWRGGGAGDDADAGVSDPGAHPAGVGGALFSRGSGPAWDEDEPDPDD